MYKSPIELIYQGVEMQIERGILQAVHKQDIKVDRGELLRALQYDRNQYKKGYQDGMAAATGTGRWHLNEDNDWACSLCGGLAVQHPTEPEKWQAITAYCPNCGAKMDGGKDREE